jgi:DNA-binding transcriptional MerR regulator
MSYKIGDLSRLLNIPVETIRFYESKNIVKPQRLPDNDYRVFETWDIFYLMECLFYKGFNFSLKDIERHLKNGSLQSMCETMKKKRAELFEKVKFETMLIEKTEQLITKYETMRFNLGKYWIQKIPESCYIFFLESDGDNYGEIDKNDLLFSQWIKYFPFVISCQKCSIHDIHDHLNKIKWGFRIEKRHLEFLKLPFTERGKTEPAKICITTFMNMGERGELSTQQFEPLLSYAEQNGYKTEEEIFGEGILRTYENGKYSRLVELMLPIRP